MRKKRSFLMQLLNYCPVLFLSIAFVIGAIFSLTCGYIMKSILNTSWDILETCMCGGGILVCITVGAYIFYVAYNYVQKIKAVHRVTRLPLSDEEISMLGISSAGEYWEYIKEQISYREFALKKENAPVDELLLQGTVRIELAEQMLAFEKPLTEEEVEKYGRDSLVFSFFYGDMKKAKESKESD